MSRNEIDNFDGARYRGDAGAVANAFLCACSFQHKEAAALLLSRCIEIDPAWACMNRQFQIVDFLVEHGANINTDWSTREPASILHECAVHANYEAAQFLIDRGIDMTIHDYRWNATAEGWPRYAANDANMANFLARAKRARI